MLQKARLKKFITRDSSVSISFIKLAREQLGGSVTLKVDREKMMKEQQDSGDRKRFESTPVSLKSAEKLASLYHVKRIAV